MPGFLLGAAAMTGGLLAGTAQTDHGSHALLWTYAGTDVHVSEAAVTSAALAVHRHQDPDAT
jgi:hypothetical protein